MSGEETFVISGGKLPPSIPVFNKMSLGAYLCHVIEENGNQIALVDAVSHITSSYSELRFDCLQLADALQKRGFRRGDVIAVCSGNRLEYPVLVIAALVMGITVATVNPQYTEGELKHSLNLSRPLAIFCCPQSFNKILKIAPKLPCIREIIIFDHQEPLAGVKRIFSYKAVAERGDAYSFEIPPGDFSEDTALVLMSSGTTGLPKGVMLSHRNIFNQLQTSRLILPTSPKQPVITGLVPFFHGYGALSLLGSLVMQYKVVVMPRFEPRLFLSSIEKYRITNIQTVPPILVFLSKSPLVDQYDLSSLISIRCAAAPIGKSTLEEVSKRLNIPMDAFRQGYGMTELVVRATHSNYPNCPSSSVGRVLHGMSMKVLDTETGRPLGPNQRGELCFKGPLIMKGYIGNPEATRDTIDPEGWLHTGDIGYYDEEHNVYIVDRLKELIKVKGFQVAPVELESLLLNHPAVQDAAVIGKPSDEFGEVPVAFVVKKPGVSVEACDVEAYVANSVSPQKRLRGGVIFVTEIPKNAGGKILRRVLRDRLRIRSKL